MSVSGISSSSFYYFDMQNAQNRVQQFQQDFEQLGQDLQSGNLTAAQTDFTDIQQLEPTDSSSTSSTSTATTSSDSSISQAFNQLSQDLKSGNLTAAQQDYSTIQQDLESMGTQATQGHHHHHHHATDSSDSSSSSSGSTSPADLLNELGQALQSGNLTSAQQAYSTLQTDLEQFALSNGALSASLSASNVSVSA
jgi:outer membrane protein assembly factor BamD (BamD/ComL family)